MTMLWLATAARMSGRGFALFLELDMADASSLQARLLGRNQTELNGLGSHARKNAVSGVAGVAETI